MKLTEKRAIELSIELWAWLAESGKEKWAWPRWEEYGVAEGNCFLCEYDAQSEDDCSVCPLWIKFGDGGCLSGDCYFNKWDIAKTSRTRKKSAKLFLEQLKELKEE